MEVSLGHIPNASVGVLRGTTLRIAHKLQRFSEDMDFTLLEANENFDLSVYLKGIEEEFAAFGLSLTTKKNIKNVQSSVNSAFIKANTLEHLLMIDGLPNPGLPQRQALRIRALEHKKRFRYS